jgi:hypothetical protein
MGGKARDAALTPERKSEIAAAAAEARWALPVAHFEGDLLLGNKSVPCAVVDDQDADDGVVRVISSAGFMRALGRPWKGSYKLIQRPNFLEAENLQAFITKEVEDVLSMYEYRTPKGAVKRGYRAQIVPYVCEVYLKARDAGVLTESQLPIAETADLIIRGLAHVGIAALVDEAAGYQEVRDRVALARILDRYLIKEGYRKWERMFQVEYYKEIFRLNGWEFVPTSTARPRLIGKLTRNIVYDRLEVGILKRLDELNPKDEAGRRKRKFFQYFTGEVGVPELKEHLSNVVFLMRSSTDWRDFIDRLDKAKPRVGDTLKLPL